MLGYSSLKVSSHLPAQRWRNGFLPRGVLIIHEKYITISTMLPHINLCGSNFPCPLASAAYAARSNCINNHNSLPPDFQRQIGSRAHGTQVAHFFNTCASTLFLYTNMFSFVKNFPALEKPVSYLFFCYGWYYAHSIQVCF